MCHLNAHVFQFCPFLTKNYTITKINGSGFPNPHGCSGAHVTHYVGPKVSFDLGTHTPPLASKTQCFSPKTMPSISTFYPHLVVTGATSSVPLPPSLDPHLLTVMLLMIILPL